MKWLMYTHTMPGFEIMSECETDMPLTWCTIDIWLHHSYIYPNMEYGKYISRCKTDDIIGIHIQIWYQGHTLISYVHAYICCPGTHITHTWTLVASLTMLRWEFTCLDIKLMILFKDHLSIIIVSGCKFYVTAMMLCWYKYVDNCRHR